MIMATSLVGQIENLLTEKRRLDQLAKASNNLASYDKWLVESTGLLLLLALQIALHQQWQEEEEDAAIPKA